MKAPGFQPRRCSFRLNVVLFNHHGGIEPPDRLSDGSLQFDFGC